MAGKVRGKVGTPRKLTPKARKRLVDAIKAGSYLSVAAKYAGISPRTLQLWLKRGRESSRGVYRELFEELTAAEAMPEIQAVAILNKLVQEKNLAGIIKFLERKYPKRWGSGSLRTGPAGNNSNQRTGEIDLDEMFDPHPPERDGQPDAEQLERSARILRTLHEIGYGGP